MCSNSCQQCNQCSCDCCCQNRCNVGEFVRIFSGEELTRNTQINQIVLGLTRRLLTVAEKRFLEETLSGCCGNGHCDCCSDDCLCS